MAQTATMGPPLSSRETRRSGRRSAPSASTSTSKSPDSDPAPRPKDIPHRPSLTSNNSGGRNKRLKQEDIEGSVDDRKNGPNPTNGTASSTHGNTNGRAKRKAKDKDKQSAITGVISEVPSGSGEDPSIGEPEEEEQGITRCVCGSAEDDPDAGEFMVQCETCKVWQHGLCMGYESEDQLHDDDYYCEQCRPEMHTELLKKLSKRIRHSSAASHHNSIAAPSRLSRSHSPSYLSKQPSKRRNTMNSRDAAFDEKIKEIIEATAAEAAAAHDSKSVTSNGNTNGYIEPEDIVEPGPSSRKKRKRIEDDAVPEKRTRSASSTSDRPMGSTTGRDETPISGGPSKAISAPAPKTTGRNKRVRRPAVHEPPALIEREEGAPTPTTKRQGNSSRVRASNVPRRPPPSHASHGPGSAIHEHGTRRNQTNGVNGQNAGSSAVEASRAYRHSHAYVVSQQPLFTSWNLPDYLAHLEHMLPTDTPRPLEVRAGPGGRGDSMERTTERGVKVKWPSKRMSVGDMNKRVRALVEWVGREQASALDRGRRRDALEKSLKDEATKAPERRANGDNCDGEVGGNDGGDAKGERSDVAMVLDCDHASESPVQEKTLAQAVGESQQDRDATMSAMQMDGLDLRSSTMKMMEELMEELIGFQERFGPGAKSRERERRLAAT